MTYTELEGVVSIFSTSKLFEEKMKDNAQFFDAALFDEKATNEVLNNMTPTKNLCFDNARKVNIVSRMKMFIGFYIWKFEGVTYKNLHAWNMEDGKIIDSSLVFFADKKDLVGYFGFQTDSIEFWIKNIEERNPEDTEMTNLLLMMANSNSKETINEVELKDRFKELADSSKGALCAFGFVYNQNERSSLTMGLGSDLIIAFATMFLDNEKLFLLMRKAIKVTLHAKKIEL